MDDPLRGIFAIGCLPYVYTCQFCLSHTRLRCPHICNGTWFAGPLCTKYSVDKLGDRYATARGMPTSPASADRLPR